jgi:hypothetical protein
MCNRLNDKTIKIRSKTYVAMVRFELTPAYAEMILSHPP